MSKYVKDYEFLTQCLNTIAKEIKFTFKVMPSLANEETVLVTIEGCVTSVAYLLRDIPKTSTWSITELKKGLYIEFPKK